MILVITKSIGGLIGTAGLVLIISAWYLFLAYMADKEIKKEFGADTSKIPRL